MDKNTLNTLDMGILNSLWTRILELEKEYNPSDGDKIIRQIMDIVDEEVGL